MANTNSTHAPKEAVTESREGHAINMTGDSLYEETLRIRALVNASRELIDNIVDTSVEDAARLLDMALDRLCDLANACNLDDGAEG